MTQVFQDDGRVVPVTLVEVDDSIELSEDLRAKEVIATGTSKGKGFTGVIKRWHFKRQPVTRGASNKIRTGGAIGAQTPGKVFKGKKMAGHKGNSRVTIRGLEVVDVDLEKNVLMVSGSLPGARNSEINLKVAL